MPGWRMLSTGAVVAAIGGCAALVIAMGTTDPHPAGQRATPTPTSSSTVTALRAAPTLPSTSSAPPPRPRTTARPTPKPTPKPKPPPPVTHAAPPVQHSTPVPPPKPKPKPTPAPVRGQALPLGYSTGNATQVITVVGSGGTTATLQAWTKAPGGGWLPHTGQILAHLGSQGMTTHPSESLSATPMGSFTLTQAFGALANPGTALPYTHTDPSYWWISQSGPLYNTMQHCSGSCPFTQGDPNEHLYYETPYYNYAVVIDYNRWPVVQGAGSAIFLHVTDGNPTAGCVAIPQGTLVSIMQWLNPAAHPRILIGMS